MKHLIILTSLLLLSFQGTKAQYPDTLIVKFDEGSYLKALSVNLWKHADKFEQTDAVYKDFYAQLANSEYELEDKRLEFEYLPARKANKISITERGNRTEAVYSDESRTQVIKDLNYKIVLSDDLEPGAKIEVFCSSADDMKQLLKINMYEHIKQAAADLKTRDLKKRVPVTAIYPTENKKTALQKALFKQGDLYDIITIYPSFGGIWSGTDIGVSLSLSLELRFFNKYVHNYNAFGISYQQVFTRDRVFDYDGTSPAGYVAYETGSYNPIFAYYKLKFDRHAFSAGFGISNHFDNTKYYGMLEFSRKRLGLRISNQFGTISGASDSGAGSVFSLGLNYAF